MTPQRTGFALYFLVWLALVMLPASWTILANGGYEYLADLLQQFVTEGVGMPLRF